MTHAARRPAGELEAAVLAALWEAGAPLTAPEVQHRLSGALARTTVATILARLHDKGTVARARDGRAYRYTAAVEDEAALSARRMRGELDRAPDRSGVLARFVAGLTTDDAGALRALLTDGGLDA
ncbi:BlaI/MecI/CopY family transcriptional regulator [Streptomyces sp. SL13]|uniref:BlaI/MecI/CopY family transcriptional regulator n=1 Tax=Streptantibioticus silvisoli TaxID=2705255 RepID=A0AA90H2Z8_9ACTN|nr:BlaI/MecI/CopY family transcriptional regulator [Streptantibioticus silvisoli]MDI5962900.1 BlaI/MecI/CopY family transcriptional regulator [Streptantibioticus silvisoli]MDI5969730.1 BlaI/MecI/CopY family transcriptional regulator [Streptantibioticus silvisoli]